MYQTTQIVTEGTLIEHIRDRHIWSGDRVIRGATRFVRQLARAVENPSRLDPLREASIVEYALRSLRLILASYPPSQRLDQYYNRVKGLVRWLEQLSRTNTDLLYQARLDELIEICRQVIPAQPPKVDEPALL